MPRALTKLTVCWRTGERRPFRTAVVSGAVSVSVSSPVYSILTVEMRPPARSMAMLPMRSQRLKYGWMTCRVAFVIGDALTAVATGSPWSACATPTATSVATPACASFVDAPRCGVSATFVMPRNGFSSGFSGSFGHTSMPAPATLPDFSASASALISTTAPRDALTRRTPSFILASSFFPIMPRVSSVSGVCRVM